MFNITHYLSDTDFQIVYINKEIDLINYERINYMEDTKISISYKLGTIVVLGENIRVKKLLDNEMVICGDFTGIEFRN